MMKRSWISIAVCLAVVTVLSPLPVNARGGTNDFPIGRILSAEKVSSISNAEILKQTIGGVSENAVRKYGGDMEAYIAARGGRQSRTIGGKAFEALTVKRFRRMVKNGEQLIPTAVLGNPADAADLVRLNIHGEIVERYQLKLGGGAAKKALTKDIYHGMTIVTPPDELKKIVAQLEKEKNKCFKAGKNLSAEWAMIDEAIKSGRLTDKVAGVEVPTSKYSISRGVRYVETRFQHVAKTMENTAVGKMVVKVAERIPESKLVVPATKVVSKVTIRSIKFAGKLLGPADIAFSAWQMQHTISQRHLYDDDLFAGRMTTQGGLMAVGVGFLLAPEPTVTKVIGGICVTVALVGTDFTLEQAHERRLDSRKVLMKNLDNRNKHEAAADLIRMMIEKPGGRF